MLISHDELAKPYIKVKITDSYFFHSISQTFAPGNPLTEPLLSWRKRETINKCKPKTFKKKTYKKDAIENSACKKLHTVPVCSSQVL